MDSQEEYLTPGEVAKRLRVDRTTVQRWIRTGALEAKVIQRGSRHRFLIPKAAIERIEQLGQHEPLV